LKEDRRRRKGRGGAADLFYSLPHPGEKRILFSVLKGKNGRGEKKKKEGDAK